MRTLSFSLALITLTLGLSLSAHALDWLGTSVTFGWDHEPAEGYPVAEAFDVFVARNVGEFQKEQNVTEKRATIMGVDGESIQIKVRAVVGELFGPLSEPSDPVTFRAMSAPTKAYILCAGGAEPVPVVGMEGWYTCP
jgi:hypothetical protein